MTTTTCQADSTVLSGDTFLILLRRAPWAQIAAACQIVLAAGLAAALAFGPPSGDSVPVRVAVDPLQTLAARAQPGGGVEAMPDARRALQGLLVQAGLKPDFDVHRLSWGQARRLNALMPEAGAVADIAKPFHLSMDTKDGRQALHCLTQAAYFEAGANGPEAEAAVVQVVLNRVRHPDFPKSVCGVVYQGSARKTGCQFSFTCDGALERGLDAAAWNRARKVAVGALEGYVAPQVGAATYYHADYVFPVWAPGLIKMATVGPHIFYRMAGVEGHAAFLTGKYLGHELTLSKAVLGAADARTQKQDAKAVAATLKLAAAPKPDAALLADGRVHLHLADVERVMNDYAKQPIPQAKAAPPAAAPAVAADVSATPRISPVASVEASPSA